MLETCLEGHTRQVIQVRREGWTHKTDPTPDPGIRWNDGPPWKVGSIVEGDPAALHRAQCQEAGTVGNLLHRRLHYSPPDCSCHLLNC